MRPSTILLSTLAAGPLAVSAAGSLGFCLANTNADGSCKVQSDYETDMQVISQQSGSKLVRTYSNTDQYGNVCNTAANILPAAQSQGFKVLVGMWPDGGAFDKEFAALQSANLGQYTDALYGITVGSEGIYRGTYSEQDLVGWIGQVASAFQGVQIGTADSWNSWANGSMDSVINSGISLALCNGFAYWQYQEINNATHTYFDDMSQALGHIQEVTGSLDKVHFMNGETGWPTTGGSNAGAALAGTNNAKQYWQTGVCGMLDWGVDLFYFEAFDEPKKADAVGTDGQAANEQHWGAMNSDRSLKFSLQC